MPALIPLTMPVVPTVAIDEFDEDHEPPELVLLNVVVFSIHTTGVPVIEPASGSAFTVTINVADALPQLFTSE